MSGDPRDGTGPGGMVGTSAAMCQVFELVERVADADTTVLITGESGTGKELVARAIHERSARRGRPLVPVNCAAIPEGLLESELFGHAKGAFTGAHKARLGRFSLAHEGTVFLDEVGEMSPALQAKLLRVLQEREFEPVGDTRSVRVDVRVVAATNRNLEIMVSKGRFREDLYYRLAVIPVALPPLRARRDDVPLLLAYFLTRFAERNGRNSPRCPPPVMRVLKAYGWPGNVRELENLAERLVILCAGDEVEPDDVPAKFRERVGAAPGAAWDDEDGAPVLPEEGLDLRGFLQHVEYALIDQALDRTDGNRNQAARLLSLNRTTLVEKLRKRDG